MKFDAQAILDNHGGRCKTVNGRDVVIYAIYPEDSDFHIHGAVLIGEGGYVCQWGLDGCEMEGDQEYNLVMPKVLVRTTLFYWNDTWQEFMLWDNIACSRPGAVLSRYSDGSTEAEVLP